MNSPFTFPADAGPFVWVLLALAFIAVVFAVERTMFLHRGLILSSDFIEGVKNNLKANRPIEALTACEESPGPIPRVVKAALLRSNQSEASMRAASIEAAMLELPVLERRLGTIATIGKIAPLIGLTAALFSGFHLASALRDGSIYASAQNIFPDILSAFANAGFSLVIAIGCSLSHHFLVGRVRSIVLEMEIAAHSLITFVHHELPAEKILVNNNANPFRHFS